MSEYYVGEIRMFTRAVVPVGWHLCDGSLLPISEYEALYTLLGTNYGGNGVDNFALPDLRGRVALGQGAGPNLTARTLASTGGTETATVNLSQIPAHTHAIKGTSATGITGNPSGNMWANTGITTLKQYSTDVPDTDMSASALNSSGSGSNVAHNNMMPSLTINFIIALNGLYPQQS